MDIEAPIKPTATTETTIVEEMKPQQVEEAKPINHDPVEPPKESEVTQLTPVDSTPPIITQLAVPEKSPPVPMEVPTTTVAALLPPPPVTQPEGPAPNVTVNASMGMPPYGYGPRPSYYPMPPYQQGYPNYPYGHHMPPYQQNYHMNQPPYDPQQAHPSYPPPQSAPLHPIHSQVPAPTVSAPSSVPPPSPAAIPAPSVVEGSEETKNGT